MAAHQVREYQSDCQVFLMLPQVLLMSLMCLLKKKKTSFIWFLLCWPMWLLNITRLWLHLLLCYPRIDRPRIEQVSSSSARAPHPPFFACWAKETDKLAFVVCLNVIIHPNWAMFSYWIQLSFLWPLLQLTEKTIRSALICWSY